MNQELHPDTLRDYHALKAITRGGTQAADDKAMEAYMKAYVEVGREEAEKVFFDHFKKANNAVGKRKG